MAHFNWPKDMPETQRGAIESQIKIFMNSEAGSLFQWNVSEACAEWERNASAIASSAQSSLDYLCKLNGVFEVFKELRDKSLGLVGDE